MGGQSRRRLLAVPPVHGLLKSRTSNTARTSHSHIHIQPRRALQVLQVVQVVQVQRSDGSAPWSREHPDHPTLVPPPSSCLKHTTDQTVDQLPEPNSVLSELAARLRSPIWKRGATPRGVRGGQPAGLTRLSRLKWMTVEIFLWECGGGGRGGGG